MRKIARSISAFANAKGGRLLIGVKDNGVVAGVRNEEDVYIVELAASRYCDPPQEVEFKAYSFDTNINVIIATISPTPDRPVSVIEADGSQRAYFRVADENIVAHPLMVKAWQYSEPLSLSLDSTSTRLIKLLNEHPEGLDTRTIALKLHLSQRATDSLITQLLAADILSFTYHSPSFRITVK